MLAIHTIDHPSRGLDIIRTLFQEYLDELDENLAFQSVEDEVKDPLKKYGPPHGCLLLAYWNNDVAGCVALQPLEEEGLCEMKRLFVRPGFREHGIGDELVKQILIEAEKAGYQKMVLDTLDRLKPAIRLYQKHGFNNGEAYYKNPLQNVVYMEKLLK